MLMLATICDDTLNVHNMQHTTPNSKKKIEEIIQTSMVVALKRIEGTNHIVEGDQ